MNREMRRRSMKRRIIKISALYEKIDNKEKERAYLHPRKGWRGKKKIILSAGHKLRQRCKIGM